MKSPEETVEEPPNAQDATGHASDRPTSLESWIRGVVLIEKTVAGVFLMLIVLSMGTQVFARYVFDKPFQWSEELARLALIWMTFVSATFVLADGQHIAVDMLSNRLGARGKFWIECLGHTVVAGACLLLLIGSVKFVWYVGAVESPALGVPKSWWYGAGLMGLFLMALHSLLNLLQVCRTGNPSPREKSIEDEGFHLEMEQHQ